MEPKVKVWGDALSTGLEGAVCKPYLRIYLTLQCRPSWEVSQQTLLPWAAAPNAPIPPREVGWGISQGDPVSGTASP